MSLLLALVLPNAVADVQTSVPLGRPCYYQSLFYCPVPPTAADNTVTIDKWQQPFSVAVKIPRWSPQSGSPFIPREATVDNTTVTVWPLTQGVTARPISRVAPQGVHLFVAREATVDNTTNRVWPLIV